MSVLSDIDISQLDSSMDMILLGMRKNGLCAFYIATRCLYLYQCTFSVVSDDEINFQS